MRFITTDKKKQVYECIEATYRCCTVKARLERVGKRWAYDATVTYSRDGVERVVGTVQASSISKFQAKLRVEEFLEQEYNRL
jgi:glycine cleavage system regulatory protein